MSAWSKFSQGQQLRRKIIAKKRLRERLAELRSLVMLRMPKRGRVTLFSEGIRMIQNSGE